MVVDSWSRSHWLRDSRKRVIRTSPCLTMTHIVLSFVACRIFFVRGGRIYSCANLCWLLWTRVHGSVVRAVDCRSAGPWFNSGWKSWFTFMTCSDNPMNQDISDVHHQEPDYKKISKDFSKEKNFFQKGRNFKKNLCFGFKKKKTFLKKKKLFSKKTLFSKNNNFFQRNPFFFSKKKKTFYQKKFFPSHPCCFRWFFFHLLHICTFIICTIRACSTQMSESPSSESSR